MNAKPRLLHWIYFSAAAPHALEAPYWTTLVCALILAWSYAIHISLVREPNRWIVQGLVLVAVAAVYSEFRTFLGPEPATALLMMLAGLKLIESRTERDTIVFLFVGILLVMYWLLYSQTLLTTLYMFGMLVIFAVAFIAVSAPREDLRKIIRSSPKLVAKDLLWSVPIFLGCFLLFPRFSAPWAQYLAAQQPPKVGFSGDLRPGEMANLAQSQELAFRVQFLTRVPKTSELYFRGAVLDVNRGFEWDSAQNRDWRREGAERGEPEPDYQVVLEPKFQQHLFALDGTRSLQWPKRKNPVAIYRSNENVFRTTLPLIARVAYSGFLGEKGAAGPSTENHLQVGFEPSERLTALVNRIRNDDLSVAVNRILNHFSDNGFTYTLNTPEMTGVEDFLFEKKSGFCEHYASAFAVLARMSGIPARVVLGFQGGEFNPYDDTLIVRDSNAHAWVEVHDASRGWVRIDPTASVNRGRLDLGRIDESLTGNLSRASVFGKIYYSVAMAWDAVNHQYTQFIMNYSSDEIVEGLEWNLSERSRKWLLTLVTFLVAVSFYFVVKRLRFRGSKKKDLLLEEYRSMLARFSRSGLTMKADLTPNQARDNLIRMYPVAESDLRELFSEYNNVRYGQRENAAAEAVVISRLRAFSIPD